MGKLLIKAESGQIIYTEREKKIKNSNFLYRYVTSKRHLQARYIGFLWRHG